MISLSKDTLHSDNWKKLLWHLYWSLSLQDLCFFSPPPLPSSPFVFGETNELCRRNTGLTLLTHGLSVDVKNFSSYIPLCIIESRTETHFFDSVFCFLSFFTRQTRVKFFIFLFGNVCTYVNLRNYIKPSFNFFFFFFKFVLTLLLERREYISDTPP